MSRTIGSTGVAVSTVFVGREPEQQAFHDSVFSILGHKQPAVASPPDLRTFLIYGDSGMGKSALLRQFLRIARDAGFPERRILMINLHYKQFFSADALALALATAIRQRYDTFDYNYQQVFARRAQLGYPYRDLQRQWADWNALQAIDPSELDALLRTHYRSERASVIRQTIFGASYTPTHIAAQAERVIDRITSVLSFRERMGRAPDSFDELLHDVFGPGASLFQHEDKLGKALAEDICNLAEDGSGPLLLAIDGYERADPQSDWLRATVLARRSDRLLTLIGSRSRPDAGYRSLFGSGPAATIRVCNLNQPLEQDDIKQYLTSRLFQADDLPAEVPAETHTITRGVPLAVAALGDQFVSSGDIGPYRGTQAAAGDSRSVMRAIMQRFLGHVLDERGADPSLLQYRRRDSQRIRALSILLRPDETLACMVWGVTVDEGREIVDDLAERYSFMFEGCAPYDMQDLARECVREDTLRRTRHAAEWQSLAIGLRRARPVIEDRRTQSERLIERSLASSAQPYDHAGWREATLDLLNVLLWLGEYEAARLLLLRCWIEARYANAPFADWLLDRAAEIAPSASGLLPLVRALQTQDYEIIQDFAQVLDPQTQAVLYYMRAQRSEVKAITDQTAPYLDQHIALLDQAYECHAEWPPLRGALWEALSARGYYLLYKQNNYTAALADFDRALTLRPADPTMFSRRGAAKHYLGDMAGALADYDEALSLEPDHAATLFSRGVVKRSLGDLAGACDDLDAALKLHPKDAVALNQRGIVRHALGDLAGALADFDESLNLRPNHPATLCNRGQVKAAQGDLPGALADLDSAHIREPDDPGILGHRGRIQHTMAHPQPALTDLDRSLELRAAHPATLYWRGRVKADLLDLKGALADFDQSLALHPNNPDALSSRGRIKHSIGALASALADFDRALILRPSDPTSLAYRGQIKYLLGDQAGALADFDRALILRPDQPAVLYNRGRVKHLLGDQAGALADFDRALILRPDQPTTLYNRGCVKTELGDLSGALADFDQALVLDPHDSNTLTSRGRIKHSAGDLSGALADFDRALILRPDQPTILYNRGCVKADLADLHGALDDFDRALILRPGHPETIKRRGLTKARMGRYIGALPDFWALARHRAGSAVERLRQGYR